MDAFSFNGAQEGTGSDSTHDKSYLPGGKNNLEPREKLEDVFRPKESKGLSLSISWKNKLTRFGSYANNNCSQI